MLLTALAQLRLAASLALGIPFAPWAFDRLIDGALATLREFGSIGPEGAEVLSGPALDQETRRAIQTRRFRAQAVRAARETAYYGRLFANLGQDPARLRHEDIARLPLTPKAALRADPDAFVRRGSTPVLRSLTTGTTGPPTAVAFSADELRTMVALSALGFLFQHALAPEDIVQISTSSRAVLGNLGLAGACARIGATCYQAGQVEPARALALLAEGRRVPGKKRRTSVLSAYPSYLGELVECGLRLGYRPADFGLERVLVGGAVVTAGLLARARRLFGDAAFVESHGMTEMLPMGGQVCSHGHLHFEVAHGLLEVRALETGAPAAPGEAGTLVVTPFPPFRETTLLLRYDTEDVARPLAGPLACSLRTLPATTTLLGKRRLAVRHDGGWTYPRDVLEALEAVEAVPLPARCGFRAVPGGVAVEVVAREDTPAARRAIAARLAARGVPLRELHLVRQPRQLRRPLPLRCDLRETSFGPAPPAHAADRRTAADLMTDGRHAAAAGG